MTPEQEREAVERIEANVAHVVASLSDWSRHMAARFNGAVYLIGSTLHHPTPRDCDIRIVVADDEFAARFGMELYQTELNEFHRLNKERGLTSSKLIRWNEEGPTQRWVDDMAKLGGAMSKRASLNIDVKVWPDSHWHPPYPAPLCLAAPSPRWFIYNKHVPEPSSESAA